MTVLLPARRRGLLPEPAPPPAPVPTSWSTGTRVECVLTERDHKPITVLQSAEVTEVVESLDIQDGATIKWSSFDPAIGNPGLALGPLDLLIDIYMDGAPIMRCPILDSSVDEMGVVSPILVSEKVWFTKRVFGRPDPPSLYGRTGFDATFGAGSFWEAVGYSGDLFGGGPPAIIMPTVAAVTSPEIGPGINSLTIGGTGYVKSNIYTEPSVVPTTYKAVWWVKSTGTYTGNALEVRRYVTEADLGVYFGAADVQGATIANAEPAVGGWQRITVTIQVPAGAGQILQTRLYSPSDASTGTWAGNYKMVWNKAFVTAPTGEDIGSVFQRLVAYMQDTTEGKTDLGFTAWTPTAGTSVIFNEPHYLHRTMAVFRDEQLVNIAGGVDWGMVYLRDRTVVATGTPRFGVLRPDRPLTLDRFLAIRWTQNGTSTATDVFVMGTHSDFSAEEGAAIDRTGTGGLSIDDVYQAPTGTDVGYLDQVAERRLEVISEVPVTVEADLPAEAWWYVNCGDTFNADHWIGETHLTGIHRVQAKHLFPVTGLLTLDLAPIDFGKNLADGVASVTQRVTQIEKSTRPFVPPGVSPIRFSLPYDLFGTITSDWATTAQPGTMTKVVAVLSVAAGSDVTVFVESPAGAVCSVTIPSGSQSAEVLVGPISFGPSALFRVSLAGASSGSGLVVTLVMADPLF